MPWSWRPGLYGSGATCEVNGVQKALVKQRVRHAEALIVAEDPAEASTET